MRISNLILSCYLRFFVARLCKNGRILIFINGFKKMSRFLISTLGICRRHCIFCTGVNTVKTGIFIAGIDMFNVARKCGL